MSNRRRTVLYIGVTNNLALRSHEHKFGEGSYFTKKYNCTDLLYFECFDCIEEAITREKQLKKWRVAWKWDLIHKMNPDLRDLYEEVDGYT